MSKIKIVLALPFLILAIVACNTLTPTAEPSSPTTVIVTEQTQTQSALTAIPTQEQAQLNIPQTVEQVARISLADAKKALDNQSALFIDTRGRQAYEASHIKGALYIGDFESSTKLNADKNQWIITYCT